MAYIVMAISIHLVADSVAAVAELVGCVPQYPEPQQLVARLSEPYAKSLRQSLIPNPYGKALYQTFTAKPYAKPLRQSLVGKALCQTLTAEPRWQSLMPNPYGKASLAKPHRKLWCYQAYGLVRSWARRNLEGIGWASSVCQNLMTVPYIP